MADLGYKMGMRTIHPVVILVGVALFSSIGLRADPTVVNVSASLYPVEATTVEGLSQAQLQSLVEAAMKDGATDRLHFRGAVDSGKKLNLKRVREFWYPTEYTEGMVIRASNDKGEYSLPLSDRQADGGWTYLVPAAPTKMAATELGYDLQLKATVQPGGRGMALDGSLSHRALAGFQKVHADLTVKRQNGKKTHTLKTLAPTRAVIEEGSATIATTGLKGTYYIPYAIPISSQFEVKNEAIITSQDAPAGEVTGQLPLTVPKQLGTRPGVLVVKAERDLLATTFDSRQVNNKPAGDIERQVYTTSKWLEFINESTYADSAGIFTDAQFQMYIRAMNQLKGVDLLSAPSLVSRHGDKGRIDVLKQFQIPVAYDPPQVHEEVLSSPVKREAGAFPVTPATPRSLQKAEAGIILDTEVEIVGSDRVRLKVKATTRELLGFVNYGHPVITLQSKGLNKNKPILLTENRMNFPVFAVRQTTSEVTLPDGHSIAVSVLKDRQIKQVTDSGPLGINKKTKQLIEDTYQAVFIQSVIIDPAGKAVNE